MTDHQDPSADSPPARDAERGERGSIALVAILGLTLLALGLATAALDFGAGNVEHGKQVREDLELHYVAVAAVNDAIAEVRQGVDGAGSRAFGLGALGIDTPLQVVRNGRVLGEYRTYVVNKAANAGDPPQYYVRALAASPSFAAVAANDPQARRATMEARVASFPKFAFAPNAGAISVSGPVGTWSLNDWSNPDLKIDGNGAPAIVLTDKASYDSLVGIFDDNWSAGWGLSDNVTGAPMVTHLEGQAKEFDAPLLLADDTALSAQVLNDYRNALRSYAEGLVSATPSGGSKTVDLAKARAAGVVILDEHPAVKDGAGAGKPRIKTDLTLGGANDPKTVLIDTSKFYQGGSQLTDNHSRTITGEGTLIIMHPIGSSTDNANGKQFNLNWKGNVFVLGYPNDATTGVGQNSKTDNLLFISRADWNVEGNLMVLSSGTTEASLELRGEGADNANLNINGGLLMFAEATGRESEIDIEASAHVTVNGLVAVYGKRAEIESQSSASGNQTSLVVNGTFATGFPSQSGTSAEFQVEGNTQFNFNQGNVDTAVKGLAQLQADLKFQNEIPQTVAFSSLAVVTRATPATFAAFQAELAGLVGAGTPLGVDILLIQNNAKK